MNVVYIAGYGRSGSTILEKLFSKKLSALSLGESYYFYNSIEDKNKSIKCSCGKKNYECDFWKHFNNCKSKNLFFKTIYDYAKQNNFKTITDSSKTTRKRILYPLKYRNASFNLYIVVIKRRIEHVINSRINFQKRNKKKYNRIFIVLTTLINFIITHFLTYIIYKLFYSSTPYKTVKYEDLEDFDLIDLFSESLNNEKNKNTIHMIGGNRIRFNNDLHISVQKEKQFPSKNLIYNLIDSLNGY